MPFGTPGRVGELREFFARNVRPPPSAASPIYHQAVNLVGDAPSPYAAAIGLEQWFRNTGGFTCDELPDASSGGQPPLAEFVLVGKNGYRQQYAGSMALMLRLLGVPARVAAGLVPGNYDETLDQWTVTDRDVHTWAEVWFPGFGWLPFDPPPGRGELVDTYSISSADIGPAPRLRGALRFGGFRLVYRRNRHAPVPPVRHARLTRVRPAGRPLCHREPAGGGAHS